MENCALLQQIPNTSIFDEGDIYDTIDMYVDNDKYETLDLEELWDLMHYLLTGASAIEPIEGNLKSEALAGVELLDLDQQIACMDHQKVKAICKAMAKIDFSKCLKKYNVKRFIDYEIYPDIWDEYVDEMNMKNRLIHLFESLQLFYKHAAELGFAVVVTHYNR